jgi:hypothetical protein
VTAIQSRHLGLAESLDDRENRGIDKADIRIGVDEKSAWLMVRVTPIQGSVERTRIEN